MIEYEVDGAILFIDSMFNCSVSLLGDEETMTNEEIDERRGKEIAWEITGKAITQRSLLVGVNVARVVRYSDEAAHLGYYDTRTHVAVPRNPTNKMIDACWGFIPDQLAHELPQKCYRAMLAACEEDKPND